MRPRDSSGIWAVGTDVGVAGWAVVDLTCWSRAVKVTVSTPSKKLNKVNKISNQVISKATAKHTQRWNNIRRFRRRFQIQFRNDRLW